MALYTEISGDILANLMKQDEQERLRRLQAQAQTQQNRIDANTGGLGGLLGGIVGGIGKGIGDIAKGTFGVIGGGVAGVKDLIEGKAGSQENQNAFKRWLYDAETDKDAAAKAAGTALNAATTLGTAVIPGVAGAGSAAAKLGTGIAANTAAGAIGGIADEFQYQGANANMDSAANRALSGAAAGLATAGLNRKIGNATGAVSSKLLNNKLATSTLGRGALSGAVGGATGAGTSAALGGGDVAQAALQGATSGALAGATQAGLMAGANRLGQGVRNRLGGNQGATEVATTTTTNTEEPFAAYGESQLAKRTRGNQTADAIRRFGEELEGAQTNITRPAARKLGIESTGKVVDNVRKRTGITDIDVQAQLARELTGGENSLLDDIQRNALTATEDGSGRFVADTGNLLQDAEKIVRKYLSAKGENAVKSQIDDVRYLLTSKDSSLLDKANRYEEMAAELRNKGVANATPGDKALSKVYKELATKLEDMSYNAIPKDNVDAMFGAAVSEMRARSSQANNNGNKVIAKAYDMLATEMENTPHTIANFRKFKKDFVDATKVNTLTEQAQNGAAQNLGQTATGTKRAIENLLFSRAIKKGAAKLGGAINDRVVPLVDNLGGVAQQGQPLSQNTNAILGNYIGRTEGVRQADENVRAGRAAEAAQNLEGLLGEIQTSRNNIAALEELARPTVMTQAERELQNISGAMNNALAAGDIQAYNQLASLYQTAYKMYELQNPQDTTKDVKLSKTQQQANAAALALDELENMNPDFGYRVKDIPGLNLVNATGNKYASTADSLAMQIGYMLSGANIKEEEARKIGSAYVPQPFDDDATRRYKLQQARNIIQQYQNTYVTDANNA